MSNAWLTLSIEMHNSMCRYQVYPKLDDRLPHRGIVKVRKSVTGSVAAMAQMQAMRRKIPAPPQLPQSPSPGKSGAATATPRAALSAPPTTQVSPPPPKTSNGNATVPAAPGGQKLKRCPICNAGFNKGTYLKRHIASHSQNKPHKCDICGWGQCSLAPYKLRRHFTPLFLHAQVSTNIAT